MFKKPYKPEEKQEEHSLMCKANGCPMLATNKGDGTGWTCVHHAFAMPDAWNRITEGLCESKWLNDFTVEIIEMDKKRQDWREFAAKFWGDDYHAIPAPKEPAANYINRMKGELGFRAGAMPKRPNPRIPEVPKKRFGNLGMFTQLAD